VFFQTGNKICQNRGGIIQKKRLAKSLAIGMLLVMKATVTVDEVGRMVLPKEIREAIGVSGRTTVRIEVVDRAALISAPDPAARETGHKRGRLVYTGSVPENWDSGEAVLKMRERRLRR
jgi:AbrB family looped-hinge helix DNA binding protein